MTGSIPYGLGNEKRVSVLGIGKLSNGIGRKCRKYFTFKSKNVIILKNLLYMSVPSFIQNHILVELPKAFQDEIISDGGLRLYKDTTFRPEWSTTVQGKVASTPKSLTMGGGNNSIDPDRPLIKQIVKEGDEIVFNYLVVMNRGQTENVGDIFTREDPINPFTTVWSNPNGLQIVRIYLMNNKYEIGLFDTKSKTWAERIKGNESDVESFLGKYMPTQNVNYNYRNIFTYEGKDYWKVDYSNAIAIKRADGSYEMIGEFVLIEPIREPRRGTYQGVIEIYNIEQDTDYRAIGKVVSIGLPLEGEKPLSIKQNDTIVTDIRYVEKYEIDGHDYWVVRQKYIYGKQSVTNDTRRSP